MMPFTTTDGFRRPFVIDVILQGQRTMLLTAVLRSAGLWYIILLTDSWLSDGVHAATPVAAPSKGPESSGSAASASGESDRSALRRECVLRPSRRRAGEVRNAAPGSYRWNEGVRCGASVRFLPPRLLSGRECLRAGRLTRTSAAQAGATRTAQAHRRGAGSPRCEETCGRLAGSGARACSAAESGVWDHCTPPQHRAESCPVPYASGKKTPVSADSACVGMPDVSIRLPAADYGEAYERMRACVKAESAHGPRYVAGLGLVLQEGVAGWLSAHARVCSATADATAI